MFIKYDDLDMLEFFCNEPIPVNEGDAKFIYSLMDESRLSLTVTIGTYERTIDISIQYNNNIVFAGKFENIFEIRKSGDMLIVEMEGKKRLLLKKKSCLGVVMENVLN